MVLTETILGKIEDQAMQARNHPGIKIGNEKYLGIKEDLTGQIGKQQKVIIENIKNKDQGGKKRLCCK